jgi:hypothetical protein
MRQHPTIITVFGSSRPRFGDSDYAEAQSLGPLVALGNFWRPIIKRVQKVEVAVQGSQARNREEFVRLASSPKDAAGYLAAHFKARGAGAGSPSSK